MESTTRRVRKIADLWGIRGIQKARFIFLLIFPLLSAFRVSCEDYVVVPEKSQAFTQDEVLFTLEITGRDFSEIQFDLPEIPPGARFISSSKTYDSSTASSKIQFWFTFSHPGIFEFPPIQERIARRRVEIPFAPVEILQNPSLVFPEIELEFSSGGGGTEFFAGEKIRVDVFARYCVQILNFSFEIPRDSIFSEEWRSPILRDGSRFPEFSPSGKKIATFLWTPLSPGELPPPAVFLEAISYSGERRTATTFSKNPAVLVLPFRKNLPEDAENPIFSESFMEEESSASGQNPVSAYDARKIASLRSRERRSMPFSESVSEREEFERSLGIEGRGEDSVPLCAASLIVSFLFLLLIFFAALKRHAKTSVFLSMFLFVSAVFFAMQFRRTRIRHAISLGGPVNSVPEPPRSGESLIPAGVRVKILEDVPPWLYVESDETGGWMKSDDVERIR